MIPGRAGNGPLVLQELCSATLQRDETASADAAPGGTSRLLQMGGVLVGFAIIGFVILVGYIVERFGIAGANAGQVLNRVAFFVATPALLFTVLAHADVSVLFSSFLLTVLSSVVIGAILYLVFARVFFRLPVSETALGAASAVYVNANNIGLPVAVYVLGNAQYVAPVQPAELLRQRAGQLDSGHRRINDGAHLA